MPDLGTWEIALLALLAALALGPAGGLALLRDAIAQRGSDGRRSCMECGTPLQPDARFCAACGTPARTEP